MLHVYVVNFISSNLLIWEESKAPHSSFRKYIVFRNEIAIANKYNGQMHLDFRHSPCGELKNRDD